MFLYLSLGIQLFFKVYFRIIVFPLFMVIILYFDNLFVVIFLHMCIIFIYLNNVYIGKLTFNQLLYQAVVNNQLPTLAIS